MDQFSLSDIPLDADIFEALANMKGLRELDFAFLSDYKVDTATAMVFFKAIAGKQTFPALQVLQMRFKPMLSMELYERLFEALGKNKTILRFVYCWFVDACSASVEDECFHKRLLNKLLAKN